METKKKLSDAAKLKIGNKNPNYREIQKESEIFIKENIRKPINWIKTHLKEKLSRHRLVNRINQFKKELDIL